MDGVITAPPTSIIEWHLPDWLSGMKVEIVKDCDEYYMMKLIPPAALTGNYFYLPKQMIRKKPKTGGHQSTALK